MKPSQIFEGENSSLRKTYDNAVAHSSLIENIRKDWLQFVQTLPKRVGETPESVIADWWISHFTHAIKVTIEQKKRKYGIMYDDVSPENQEVFGVGFNFALDTILATLKDFN